MSCISDLHVMNKSVKNYELERKKELERRKILRLLQVRQQSKDFASKIRENIQEETITQRKKIFEIRRKRIQEEQLQEINNLREIYKTCLQSIGESHREATKQPNLTVKNQEKQLERTVKAAARGTEARKQYLKNEALRQQQIEAPVKQKKKARNKENLRSFYVSTLPKQIQVPENVVKPLKSNDKPSAPAFIPQVLQEIPSNLIISRPSATKSLVLDKIPENDKEIRKNSCVDYDSQKTTEVVNNILTKVNQENNKLNSSPNECCCDYVVCSCHNSPPILRRCQSDTRLNDESSVELKINQLSKSKARSRSCSPRSVKTLNYCDVGNLFESNQRSFVTITHHSTPPKTTEEEITTLTQLKEKDCSTKEGCSKEIREKSDERGRKALHREQLKKDFQQLLNDLGNLTRKKQILKSKIKTRTKVYQREQEILAKNESKQKKLADVFETLLHTVKPDQSQSSGSQYETTLNENNGSLPPTLNLALCQQVNMPRLQPIPEDSCEAADMSVHRTPHRSGSQGTSFRCPPPSTDLSSTVSEPSENIHVIAKRPPKGTKHKKKCKKFETSQIDSSTSSYYDPPDQLTPSEFELIDTFKQMCKKSNLKIDLKKYIEKLLTMRRESIDCLDVQQDRVCQPLNTVREVEDNLTDLSELSEIYKQVSHQTKSHRSSRCPRICPNPGD